MGVTLPSRKRGRASKQHRRGGLFPKESRLERVVEPLTCLDNLTLPRPRRMSQTRLLVRLHAEVPYVGRFPMRLLETSEERGRKMGQRIYPYCFHTVPFFFFA